MRIKLLRYNNVQSVYFINIIISTWYIFKVELYIIGKPVILQNVKCLNKK